MKKIKSGDEIIVLATGERGIVQEYFDDSWIIVNVNRRERSLSRDEIQTILTEENKIDADEKEAPALNLNERGIGLLFKPVHKLSGDLHYFEIHFYNHTHEALLIDYNFYLDQTMQYGFKKEVQRYENVLLHEFKSDQLNDHPLFKIKCWLKNKNSKYPDEFENEIKFKAKQFFAKTGSPEYLKNGYFTLQFFPGLPLYAEVKDEEKNISIADDSAPIDNELLSKANMPDFIDLHAENLFLDPHKIGAAEILRAQLKSFEQFIENAIRYKLHKIYVVHGLGKGILKKEIEKKLKEYPQVVSFNNHHHPRFGFGATEIFLS